LKAILKIQRHHNHTSNFKSCNLHRKWTQTDRNRHWVQVYEAIIVMRKLILVLAYKYVYIFVSCRNSTFNLISFESVPLHSISSRNLEVKECLIYLSNVSLIIHIFRIISKTVPLKKTHTKLFCLLSLKRVFKNNSSSYFPFLFYSLRFSFICMIQK